METINNKPWVKRLAAIAVLSLCGAVLLTPWDAVAAGGKGLNFTTIIMKLFGGLAIFLYGMEKMGDALKAVAGEKMKEILGKLTTNRIMGLITGMVVTAIIQSSSVTTVMLVGFVTAELMSLSQAVGVILGADIGTTITAQIVAFKVTKYASALIAIGFVMVFAGKEEKIKQYGHLTLGLGLIFFGMGEMSNAMKPLRSYEPFLALMQNFSNPVIGILVSTAFTGVIQSSSATMGVVVALAMQGLISLEGGIALAFGANIGTCATAGLAIIGKPREAIRVAVAHITFKIAGVAVAVFLIPQLAQLVTDISPQYPDLEGAERLAAEVPRQVANAHTIFNVVMAAVFLPFAGTFARFCEWVVPDASAEELAAEAADARAGHYSPKYLDEGLVDTPALALGMVRREVSLMGDTLETMITEIPEAVFKGDIDKMKEISKMDDRVDAIHEAITHYLAKVGGQHLPEAVADEVLSAMTAASELESIGDIIENNLTHLTNVCAKGGITLDEQATASLTEYHSAVLTAFRSSVTAFVSDNAQAAQHVMNMKDEISGMDSACSAKQVSAMGSGEGQMDFATFTFAQDLRENMKRIYYHTKRVAKLVAMVENAAAWKAGAAKA